MTITPIPEPRASACAVLQMPESSLSPAMPRGLKPAAQVVVVPFEHGASVPSTLFARVARAIGSLPLADVENTRANEFAHATQCL